MENSADSDQTAPEELSDLGLQCLLRLICPNICSFLLCTNVLCVNGKYSHQILFINFHFLVQTFKLKYTVYKMKLKDTGIYASYYFPGYL